MVAVWRDGQVQLRERYRGVSPEWQEVRHSFILAGLQEARGAAEKGIGKKYSAAQGCPVELSCRW